MNLLGAASLLSGAAQRLSSLEVVGNTTLGGTLAIAGVTVCSSPLAATSLTASSNNARVYLGDGTGLPGIEARKSDAATYYVADLRSGGTGTSQRRWIDIYQSNNNRDQRRYDATGTYVDTPDSMNWANGGRTIGASGGRVGFYGTTPVVRPTVSGSRGGNAAVESLLTALAAQGLITNSTSA